MSIQNWQNINSLQANCYGAIQLKLGKSIEDSYCVIVVAPPKKGDDVNNYNNGFTKGKCDKLPKENRRETFLETSIREMYEESGLVPEQLKFVNNFYLEEKSKAGITSIMYLVGVYTSEKNHTFSYNNKELVFSGWVLIPDALKMLRPHRAKLLTIAYETIKKCNDSDFTFGGELEKIGKQYQKITEPVIKPTNNLTSLSKTLSWVLRHKSAEFNLKMDLDGFITVTDLCKNVEQLKNITLDEIKMIVNNDEKSRFTLKCENNIFFIRANQGHSDKYSSVIDDEKIFKEIMEPLFTCVHGTDAKSWKMIKETGLNKMKRSHIHLAIGEIDDENVISGMRKTAKVMIYIDMKKAMDDGIKFYLSTNNVILTKGNDGVIDHKYFEKVVFK